MKQLVAKKKSSVFDTTDPDCKPGQWDQPEKPRASSLMTCPHCATSNLVIFKGENYTETYCMWCSQETKTKNP